MTDKGNILIDHILIPYFNLISCQNFPTNIFDYSAKYYVIQQKRDKILVCQIVWLTASILTWHHKTPSSQMDRSILTVQLLPRSFQNIILWVSLTENTSLMTNNNSKILWDEVAIWLWLFEQHPCRILLSLWSLLLAGSE